MKIQYQGEPDYVLRLALPLEDLRASAGAVRGRILIASLAAALLALGIAYYFSRSLTDRIGRLRTFAERLVTTSRPGTLEAGAHDELGSLADALNRTAGELRGLLERLSLKSARRGAILASMAEGVLAVNSEMRVAFSNDSFLRALGHQGALGENMQLVELVRDP